MALEATVVDFVVFYIDDVVVLVVVDNVVVVNVVIDNVVVVPLIIVTDHIIFSCSQ